MAYGFGATLGTGTTDVVVTALTAHAAQRTYVFLYNRNGAGGNNQGRIFDKRNNGGTNSELCFYDSTAGVLTFQRVWSGATGTWTANGGTITSTGVWNHIVITYDSSSTANNPVIYVNGSSVGVTRTVAPSGTIVNNNEPYHIGNLGQQIRVFDGRIAEFSVLDEIAGATDALAWARGFLPLHHLHNLAEHVPMVRDSISYINGPPTTTGALPVAHPNVIYPAGGQNGILRQAAATRRHSLLLLGVG